MTKQKHYFKQKLYLPDPLVNRSIYLDGSIVGIKIRHREFMKQSQASGVEISADMIRGMKDHEERARAVANKGFSTRIWRELKSTSLSR